MRMEPPTLQNRTGTRMYKGHISQVLLFRILDSPDSSHPLCMEGESSHAEEARGREGMTVEQEEGTIPGGML